MTDTIQTETAEERAERRRKKKLKLKKKKGIVAKPPARLDPFERTKLVQAARDMAKKIGTKYKIAGLGQPVPRDIECISTGFQPIDDVLTGQVNDNGGLIKGTGRGFPRGRIVEIFGPEAAAKTTLALCVIAQAQKRGELCAFIDAEQALDHGYASRVVGVDTDALLYSQPDCGEDALEIAKGAVIEGLAVVVIDSVAALVPKAELEGSHAQGMQARMMGAACRKLTSYLRPGGPLVIFINQIRYKLGVVFGSPETTSGGNALKFYASQRCRVKLKEPLKKTVSGETRTIGSRIELEVRKNKVGSVHHKAVFDVRYNKGISIPTLKRKKKQTASVEESED